MAGPQVAADFNVHASNYEAFTLTTPIGLLETELYFKALGDPTGLTILDLGGGTGLRARQAVERGARSVDVVDFSAEMLHIGKQVADKAGLGDRIRWYEADVSKSLSRLSLGNSYDMVLANWLFDHVDSIEALEQMFDNATTHLKSGGRLICVHTTDPHNSVLREKRYGATFSNIKEFPGGLKYWVTLYGTDPPVEFSGSSLKMLYSGSLEIFEKFGLEDPHVLPSEGTETVTSDSNFWKHYVEQPTMRVVTARKKVEYQGGMDIKVS